MGTARARGRRVRAGSPTGVGGAASLFVLHRSARTRQVTAASTCRGLNGGMLASRAPHAGREGGARALPLPAPTFSAARMSRALHSACAAVAARCFSKLWSSAAVSLRMYPAALTSSWSLRLPLHGAQRHEHALLPCEQGPHTSAACANTPQHAGQAGPPHALTLQP